MILLIDNYDSFSYNLYQLIGSINPDIRVIRNDESDVDGIRKLAPEAIIISPGPGRPENAGLCTAAAADLRYEIPILGVCLGHQSICEAYGAVISYASELKHGKASSVKLDRSSRLFAGMPEKISAARYHSLAVRPETVPDTLRITAIADDGEIMAVEDKVRPVYGLQFHPESILTPEGGMIIRNFMKIIMEEHQNVSEYI